MSKMIAERYMVIKSLGEGGMADVYLAVDTILNREVAVKVLRGELSNDPVTLLRFQREANAASKLNHPNVVQVFDVGESEGRHYIVMEHVRGRTLKQLIQLRGALHKEEAVNIMKQIVAGVMSAHENNIIHRDIKPQNIMVKDDGTIKITDFGIALAHDAVQLTQTDSVLGSAHYLAPETTRGEPPTNQIDIYAMGIVFYELLTGDVPFRGDNPVQIAMKHLSEEIPSVREFNPSLPQSIENIIIKATVKNRGQRYKKAEEMLVDLNECLDEDKMNVNILSFEEENSEGGQTMVLSHVSQVGNKREPQVKSSKTSTIIGLLLILISVIAIAGVIYFSGLLSAFTSNPPILVPDVSNYTTEVAITTLQEAGFVVNINEIVKENNDEFEADHVIKSLPAAESEGKRNDSVTLIVSKGPWFYVEDYTGKSYAEIKTVLESSNIQVSGVAVQAVDKPAGTILSQELLLAGDKIDPTSRNNKIKLTYVDAPEFVIPQNITGRSVEEVKAELDKLGAKVVLNPMSTEELTEEELIQIEKGVVVRSDPESGKYYRQTEGKVIILYHY